MALQHVTILSFVLGLLLNSGNIKATHDPSGSPPVFASQHPNVYVFETDENGNRQNLTLPCVIVEPSPTVTYTWFRGDQELPGSMVNGEGNLTVPNITEGEYASREGVDYYCIARDNIGFDVAIRSRTIIVYYAYFDGFVQTENSDRSIIEVPVALGSDVALECNVLDANPPLQIKWYDNRGEIQEIRLGNEVRFLDNRKFLYLRRLRVMHLEQQYYCAVTNANSVSQEVAAPTRYVLIDDLTQGVLMDYKPIGNLKAFVGNTSFEFAYVGGVFGKDSNETYNRLTLNGAESAVSTLGNVGEIMSLLSPGIFMLGASVSYGNKNEIRRGTLAVYQVPRITNSFRGEREHLVGEDNLTYTCEFEGFPHPRVTFYFNGVHIVANGANDVIIINNTLAIPSPQVSHSGIYQCIVSNEFGDDQAAWLLEIRQPISPQVQPYNFTKLGTFDDRDLGTLIVRDNGSTVSFSVDVVADPCPDVVWSFNGTRLVSGNVEFAYNNACIKTGLGTTSPNWTFTLDVILLTAVTSGYYSARFTNVAGTTFLPRTYITIPEPVSVIGLSLNDTCLKEGSTVSLKCEIRGFPRLSVDFRQNGMNVISTFENIQLEFYNQIAIRNVTKSNEGLYSCTIIGVLGFLPPVTERFDFCSLPRIIGVDLMPNPHTGEPFFMECIVDGIPLPNTVWMKDGILLETEQIDQNIRIISIPAKMSSRVEISKASIDDNGEYQCIVSNVAGSVNHSFYIELVQAPLSLELIIGTTSGVILFVSITILIILVIICALCRLSTTSTDKSNKPHDNNIIIDAGTNYSTNTAYMKNLCSSEKSEVTPFYEIIPYSDPAKVRKKEESAYTDAQGYEILRLQTHVGAQQLQTSKQLHKNDLKPWEFSVVK